MKNHREDGYELFDAGDGFSHAFYVGQCDYEYGYDN